ncbi:MAG: AEC family transporter [Clostridia bacterium]|nr:AEC family transporter [Clostridia bacterium]
MQEFLITLDIMLPILLLLLFGWGLRKLGLMKEQVTSGMNQLVFKVFLPLLIFNNIRTLDLSTPPEMKLSLFMALSIFSIFLLARLVTPHFVPDVRKSGVIVQAIFRTNFAILGIPLMLSMFGQEGMVSFSLAMPIVVPLFNVLAVIALSGTGGKVSVKQLLVKIVTNPLIIAVFTGLVFLFVKIPLPKAIDNVASQLANLTSPVSLLVLGASLRWEGVKSNRKELFFTILIRQLFLPCTMIFIATMLGFRGISLGVLIILFGAPIAVSSYPMAVGMGGDKDLAAGILVLSTVTSMGTLFLLIYVSKLLAFI